MNSQKVLLDRLKKQLGKDEKLVNVLEDTLCISADAAYRRMRSEVILSFDESIKLCKAFGISMDDLFAVNSKQVRFDYRSLNEIDRDFVSYLNSLAMGMKQLSEQPNQHLYASVNDTPIFQMFHFPRLSAFKFFFWSKCFLHPEENKDTLFSEKCIDPRAIDISNEILGYYNQIPSSEVYCPEALRGMLRQIQYFFDAELFENNEIVLILLDDLLALSNHMKDQAEIGKKFSVPKDGESEHYADFNMFVYDTYLPDNTYFFKSEHAKITYFSHNIMNYIFITDQRYNADTETILQQLIQNSTLVSLGSAKDRNRFFSALSRTILAFKSRIEAQLNGDF